MQLHFLHERSSDPKAIPLIFSHGWPGSFIEAFKIIKKLTNPGMRLLAIEPLHLSMIACERGKAVKCAAGCAWYCNQCLSGLSPGKASTCSLGMSGLHWLTAL